MVRALTFIWVLMSFTAVCFAEDVLIQGRLRERGTRKPLEGVNIFVLPHKIKAVTASDGTFSIPNLPVGSFQFVVNFSGYERLEINDEAQLGDSKTRELYLEKISYQVYETTILDKELKRHNNQRTLKRSEFLTMPGSGGDPIKAVQNLPGVNRVSSFSSQVVIQGAGPQDTRYLIDTHEVPLIFHFGGLTSVVSPEAIERVDYLSAGYGSEHGRANGGLVGVTTRSPELDRLHGLAFVDVINAGALLEGPIDEKSSFLIGGRQSYIGSVFKAVMKDNDSFDLTVAPKYSDLIGVYQRKLTHRDDFKFSSIYSADSLEFIFSEPVRQDPSLRGSFENRTVFFRLIPQLTHRHSERTVSRFSLGFGRDWLKIATSTNYFRLRNYGLTARGEVERKMTSEWTSMLGFDNRYNWAHVEINLPNSFAGGGVFNPLSSGQKRVATIDQENKQVGGYWRNEFRPSDTPWTFIPAVRVDYFSLSNEFLPAPRGGVRHSISPSLRLRSAGGLYYQPPSEQQIDPTYGNPDIKSQKAWHLTAGFEKDFREGSSRGWTTSVDGFYKWLSQIAIESSATTLRGGQLLPENFNNEGKGRVYGAQTEVKLDAEPWSMSLIYTLSKSERWEPRQKTHPAAFDQTHLLGVLGSYQTGNWRFSGRFRYATGNPTTPITGSVFDADNDVFIPVRGPYYSDRLPAFYQLDLRIDRKFVFDKWILSFYLDVQNATNRKSVEQTIYSYDYKQKDYITGLPILPTLGVKGEF